MPEPVTGWWGKRSKQGEQMSRKKKKKCIAFASFSIPAE